MVKVRVASCAEAPHAEVWCHLRSLVELTAGLRPGIATSTLRRWRGPLLLGLHAAVLVAAYGLSWLLRFEGQPPAEPRIAVVRNLTLVVGLQVLVAIPFGIYRGWWRYVGLTDVVRLVASLSLSLAALVGLWYAAPPLGLAPWLRTVPLSLLLIDWAFALLMLFGLRLAIRLGLGQLDPGRVSAGGAAQRVLVLGAGDAGESLARELARQPQLGLKVVGFVDDSPLLWGSEIRGVEVSGPMSEVGAIAARLGAGEALIALPAVAGVRLREIVQALSAAGLRFKTVPSLDEIVRGRLHVSQLRPVNVEDLLRRERIELPDNPVHALLRGRCVLITGAGGTIGAELAAQVLGFAPSHLHLVERSEHALYGVGRRLCGEHPAAAGTWSEHLLDVRDATAMGRLLARATPEVVIHAAAHKHVPMGERNAAEYVRNNTLATRLVAELCERQGVERFVLVSSDKAINPASVMGASKRAAEVVLLDLARRSLLRGIVVRFGNVIGSSGSVVPLFMDQIAAGGPITVTDPGVARYFLRTSEAVSLVLQAAALGSCSEVYTLRMGEPVRIVDLARDLIRLSNHDPNDIPIVYTGLRPGEKMYEELCLDGEAARPTRHPQIVVTEAPVPDATVVARWLADAERLLAAGDDPRALLGRLIGEYRPAPCRPPVAVPSQEPAGFSPALAPVVLMPS